MARGRVGRKRGLGSGSVTWVAGLMAHAVFIQNPDSIYDDRPGEAYHFPKMYLSRVKQALGQWVIFYESKRGAKEYVGTGKISTIEPDRRREGYYYATLIRGLQNAPLCGTPVRR